jgi:hypothetical protein
MDLNDLPIEKPFQIARKNKDGTLHDHTIYQINDRNVLTIWFRFEQMWLNPLDVKLHNKIYSDIEKHGIVLFNDELPIR